jgi:subtilisin family serine protease
MTMVRLDRPVGLPVFRTALLWMAIAVPFTAAAIDWQPGPGQVQHAGAGMDDVYIVHHQARPLALYAGGIPGLAANAAFATGQRRLDIGSATSRAYLDFLDLEHGKLIAAAEAAIGRALTVPHRMRLASSGFTAQMSEAEALIVSRLPGVARVSANKPMQLHTDNGPAWIGAGSIHDGSAVPGGVGSMGEGVVVGVIDTGINFDHPSFAATGPVTGHVHENPRTDPITGLPRFFGLCDPVTGLPFCNNKLIGAWDFTGTTPHDDNGHGSHTASTAAGNIIDAVLQAPTIEFPRRISGVAPHANIIAYKGCITTAVAANCAPSALLPVIDQAVADGVDVINFSIGGGANNPWTDSSSTAFLGARAAGIFVATSAGNDGPKPETLGSPADAPWLLSVAASTHDRSLGNALIGMSGGASPAPTDIAGKSLTSALATAPIVYAGDFGDNLCGTPFPTGSFDGEIVVCDRGSFGRVEKANNVAAGGAGGYVLANDLASGDSLVGDAYPIPGVHISYDDGVVLKAWLAEGSGHQGAIAGTQAVENPASGDVMASFSSRGANPSVPGVIKPDVTAPGVDILAAFHTDLTAPSLDPEYGVISGTSMSSPHAAGAAALIRAVHPDWTPDQVKSALMTTAYNVRGKTAGIGLVKEDGETPVDHFDLGAGRVDLGAAARAGLLFDESIANYEAANPAAGGQPHALNLPSLGHPDCISSCGWTRTVTATRDASWTVSVQSPGGMGIAVTPGSFALSAGASQQLSVTADVAGLATNRWTFAEIVLTPNDPSVPAAHLPVAVRVGPVPRTVRFEVNAHQGSVTVDDVVSPTPISAFAPRVFGMLPGVRTERLLIQDPTPLDPYDGPHSGPDAPNPAGGTFFFLVDVPDGGGKLLDTRIIESGSLDLDLFVGRDNNGDGEPSEDEEVCRSATGAVLEHCTVTDPPAGTYWVLVQNWLTGEVVDSVVVDTAIVAAADLGNLSVSAPAQTPANTPFPVTLSWNEPDFEVGQTWIGLVEMGSGTGADTDVGILVVELVVVSLDGGPSPPPTPPPGGGTGGEVDRGRFGGALGLALLLPLIGAALRRRRVWG